MNDFFGQSSPRILRLKERVLSAKPTISAERAKIITESYRAHEQCTATMKRAIALKDILEQMTIYIAPDELIVGNHAEGVRVTPVFPEYAYEWVINELDEFEKRPGDVFYISEQIKDELREIAPFWKGKTLYERAEELMPPHTKELLDAGIIKATGSMYSGDAHLAINNDRLLKEGIIGFQKQLQERMQRLDISRYEDFNKLQFLKGCEIVLQAAVDFAERFSALAAQMAKDEKDINRKAELNEISRICARVPKYPAESFHEGVQSMFFLQLILQLESNGHSLSFGRFDQYLYPLYKKDINNGVITQEKAEELLECTWIKLNEILKIRMWCHTRYGAGYPMYQNVTIGGQTTDKKDATNDLTYLVLKTVGRIKLPQPNLTVRYHRGLTPDFFGKCIEVVKQGFGMPAFNSDEVIIPALLGYGITEEDAYNYSAIGCVEVAVPGKWGYRTTGMTFLNMLQVLNMAIRGGYESTVKKQLYPKKTKTLLEMKSFDEVLIAWDEYIRYYTKESVILDNTVDAAIEQLVPDVLLSALVDDCIEKGLHLKEGGAHYDFISGLQMGIANLGNSLAAIKKLIYEEKKITAKQLLDALDSDFAGVEGERMRQLLLNGAPKYGQDDDYVDKLLVRAYNTYLDEIKKYPNGRTGRGPVASGYYGGTSAISSNVPAGADVGASPDGRHAFEPLAEGSSPMTGTDIYGPTAVFKSITKLRWRDIIGGILFNQKMSPSSVKTQGDTDKMISALRAFFDDLGGWHVQYNIVDRATLLDAQAYPEKHRDLVVRVAGYSAFFTALDPALQNNIIARTEHHF